MIKALAVDPKFVYAIGNKAEAIFNERDYIQSLKNIDKALSIYPNNVQLLTLKATVYDKLHRYGETSDLKLKVTSLKIGLSPAETLIAIGIALDDSGNVTGAIEYYNRALILEPHNTDALYNIGNALDELANYTGAIMYYNKVLAINPHHFAALYDEGNEYERLNNYSKAIEYYDKALVVNSSDTSTMNNKGLALDGLGKHQEAITWYDKAIKQTQTQSTGVDMDIVSNKAYDLGVQLKQYDNALSFTDQYLKKNPEHKGLLCTTAEIYNETENEAYAHYYKDRLTKLDPNYKCGLIAKVNEIEKEAFA